MLNRKSQRSSGSIFVYLALVLLSACTVVNEHKAPPADWPKLEITVEEGGFWETQEKCGRNAAEVILIGPMLGCAWVNFDEMRCRIYLWLNAVLEHELLHCAGHDHYLSSALADYWEEWKRENRK